MAVKKSTKRSGVVVYSYFKDGAFAAVKRFLQRKWHYSLQIRFWGHRKFPSILNVSNGQQKEETFFNWPTSRLHSVNMTTLSPVHDTFKSSRGFLIDSRGRRI